MKTMIIMRGLPGSGKSTVARSLGKGGAVFSTDDFFMRRGKYLYDPTKISEAHAWNQHRVDEALSRGVSPVVVDNTNVMLAHAQPYLDMARQHGYKVVFGEPDSWWWKKWFGPDMSQSDKDELVKALLQKGTHGVPENVLRRMIDQWEHDLPLRAGETKTSKWIRSTCFKMAAQQTFPWYNPSEYKPMPDPNWPDPSADPLGVLQEVLETNAAGAKSFISEYEDLYNPEVISFENACVSPADPILVIQVGKGKFVVDFEVEQIEPLQDWFTGIWDHNLANYVPCPDHNQEFWDGVHPGPGTYLYHATDPDNLDGIKSHGLRASSETRSISNKGMSDAVFSSWNEHAISSYGSLVIGIDVGMMKADGFMPRVSKEEPFEDVEMRSSLAHKLSIEYEGYNEFASEGLEEETVAIYADIPPKYLAFPE